MSMAQKLEVPTRLEQLNRVDQQILRLLNEGQLTLERIVGLVDADRHETLSAITRLIAGGYLKLVILEYPWGIEYELKAQAKMQLGPEAHQTFQRSAFGLVTSSR